MNDTTTCTACDGRGDITVIQLRHETSRDGLSGGQYAYPTYVCCGTCRGRRFVEVAS